MKLQAAASELGNMADGETASLALSMVSKSTNHIHKQMTRVRGINGACFSLYNKAKLLLAAAPHLKGSRQCGIVSFMAKSISAFPKNINLFLSHYINTPAQICNNTLLQTLS